MRRKNITSTWTRARLPGREPDVNLRVPKEVVEKFNLGKQQATFRWEISPLQGHLVLVLVETNPLPLWPPLRPLP